MPVGGAENDNSSMSSGRLLQRTGTLWFILVVGAILAYAAKEFTPPRAFPAKTYPARDEHPNEKVTIAADPYDTPDKIATVFALKYNDKGMLPVYLVITNDGDQPITLLNLKAQLVTADRTKITAATSDDLYRRMSRLARRGDEPQRIPLPVPLPRRKAQAGVGKQGEQELDNAPMKAKAVEPHATQAGFLFFDVSGLDHPLAGAHLYITGVRDASGNELMFFDIPMEKYLTYKP